MTLRDYIVKKKKRNRIWVLGIILFWGLTAYGVNFDLFRIVSGLPDMFNLVRRMLSPELSYIREAMPRLLETIEMALISTTLGVLLGVLVALFTAKNTTLHPMIPKMIGPLLTFFRTIPNLIWAAILVTIFSVGKFPGMIALTITAVLITVKLLREYIETLNKNLLYGVESVGGSKIQVLRFAVLPAIFEHSLSIYFIVLEINIRSATILGLVGAGGIGQILWRDLNHLRYDNLATLIILLFLTILIIDFISLSIRKNLKKFYIPRKSIASFKMQQQKKWAGILALLTLGLFWLFFSLDITLDRLLVGLNSGQEIILRMVQIDLSYTPRLLGGLLESLYIALFATFAGGIGAVVLSYFTAYNTAPSPIVAMVLKGVANLLRTFPPIIVAIIFFRGVGPGPLAGAMALGIYTLGVMTKLYSEVIESAGSAIQQGIMVTGSTKLNSYRYGILPQTFPNFISLILYRLESNIRTSTILGIIGAGGIGTLLSTNITWRNWERVGLLILGIALLMILIEKTSERIRKKLI